MSKRQYDSGKERRERLEDAARAGGETREQQDAALDERVRRNIEEQGA